MRKLVEPQTTPAIAKGVAGRSVKHESAHKHVSGEALFTDDIPLPVGTLHAYVGFSDIAKGKVLSMDLSRVENAEGVKAVIIAEHIPGHKDIGPIFRVILYSPWGKSKVMARCYSPLPPPTMIWPAKRPG